MKYLIFILAIVTLVACRSNSFEKSPVDNLVRDMTDVPEYSIILYDMDQEGNFYPEYKHQYRIIKDTNDADSIPEEEITAWYTVSENFFNQHIDNMGMEIVSKSRDGEISKTPAPPGYSNYVGNPQYGQWQQGAGGETFWSFYGKYALLSSLFNMAAFPVRRSYYDDYRGYRSSGRPYYGPTVDNRRAYGTNSRYTTTTKPNTTWRTRTSSRDFRSSNQRTSRASSRYSGSSTSSSSSSRSRSSGGFGK
ncbi:MAG: hypothetical protein AAGE93_08430 [Bacteroidota bacterium]